MAIPGDNAAVNMGPTRTYCVELFVVRVEEFDKVLARFAGSAQP